mgnify:CR=1 FL=1
MVRVRLATALLVVLATTAAPAGEIAGLSPPLPPYLDADFGLVFSNDFLGRGGSVDDYRTQQIVVTARLSDRWFALLDHSILTLSDVVEVGRLDQLAASFGYTLVQRTSNERTDRLAVGFGLRDTGSFGGERIQNGFHRLIGSKVEELPYESGHGTDATVWIDASHYRLLSGAGETGFLPGWRKGAWLRAASLVTTRGQWDSTAAALAMLSRSSVDLWLGVRADWRAGYTEAVLRETARAEDDVALVVGARFGPLVIETVQQFNNDASYGQLRLVSADRRDVPARRQPARVALDLGFTFPDVRMRLTGRYPVNLPFAGDSRWQESLVVAASYGEPQYGTNNRVFVRSGQLDVGLELERPWSTSSDWLRVYAETSVGWREQAVIVASESQEERSDSVGRAALNAGAGVRVDAAGIGRDWRLRIQTGIHGILPLSDAQLVFDGEIYELHEAELSLQLGVPVEFE